jgi:hypothetical protein
MTGGSDSDKIDPDRGNASGRLLFGAALIFAVGATLTLVFATNAQWLKLAVIAALWAAFFGAMLSVKYRHQAAARAGEVADLQAVYELELEREVAARREYELEVEADTRRRLTEENAASGSEGIAALRAELRALRENLERLTGGEVLVERFALRAQSTRMRSIGDPVAGPAIVAGDDSPRSITVGPGTRMPANAPIQLAGHAPSRTPDRAPERGPARSVDAVLDPSTELFEPAPAPRQRPDSRPGGPQRPHRDAPTGPQSTGPQSTGQQSTGQQSIVQQRRPEPPRVPTQPTGEQSRPAMRPAPINPPLPRQPTGPSQYMGPSQHTGPSQHGGSDQPSRTNQPSGSSWPGGSQQSRQSGSGQRGGAHPIGDGQRSDAHPIGGRQHSDAYPIAGDQRSDAYPIGGRQPGHAGPNPIGGRQPGHSGSGHTGANPIMVRQPGSTGSQPVIGRPGDDADPSSTPTRFATPVARPSTGQTGPAGHAAGSARRTGGRRHQAPEPDFAGFDAAPFDEGQFESDSFDEDSFDGERFEHEPFGRESFEPESFEQGGRHGSGSYRPVPRPVATMSASAPAQASAPAYASAGARSSGRRAAPEPAGAHAAGRSVTELIAAHSSTEDSPRRHRRRAD